MDLSVGIYVAGQSTLIGAALVRELTRQGARHLLGVAHGEPDLTSAAQVDAFFECAQPACVFVAGGRSGGIRANVTAPADLMRDNMLVAANVLHSAHRHGVERLLYLASSCSYPKHCAQPMQAESLMTGPLEPTNAAYATAKLAGMALCEAYRAQYEHPWICGIPADAFGPEDDFSLEDSHVLPALIRKMHDAKRRGAPSAEVWGSGEPQREFIFADDLASACVFVMRHYEGASPINLGGGELLSIRQAALVVKEVVGYAGELRFDPRKPDGMPVKALDTSQLHGMGWAPATDFRTAVQATYRWFLEHDEADAAIAPAAAGKAHA